jgi:hypothetical protein
MLYISLCIVTLTIGLLAYYRYRRLRSKRKIAIVPESVLRNKRKYITNRPGVKSPAGRV